ncbi:MAG TPA: tetratricopeptide repeat protein, partial [Ktedonobacteraceae bacterium]|nr:tetratricopeptide repeat protein [Ktedonobacteraceae bacterium]
MADHIAQRLEMLKQVAEANRDPLNLAINALVQATPGTLRQVIAQHPVLLDDKTLVAFDDFATQCEKEGDTTLATRLRLRLAEVRRISKEGEQVLQQHSPFRDEPVAEELYNPPRTYAEDHSISIGTHSGSGPVVQYNIDELTLPPKKWQHPGTPSNPKTFVGRKEELAQFSQYLIAGESVTISGTPATVMLQGMGGIGKTYLATQLAIEVQPYFPAGVILLKFGERILCEQDAQPLLHYLAGYAFEGHTFQIIGQLQLQPQLVKAWLEETAPGRLLVIFDDIWDSEPLRLLEQAIPANAVRIVTTRDANIAQALDGRRKELDRLTMEDGIALLEVRLGCQGNTMYHDALKKLVETLGRHAQALDVIAARIKKPQRIEAILRELEQGVGRARLNQIKLRESQIRVENLEKSLGLSYEYMTPEEKRSFRKLGVFEEEAPITLEAAQAIWGMDNASEARNLLCDLVDLSMLEETGDSYRQHSLLQTYAYALMEDEGELNGTRWAHAEYYRELAWRAETATPKDYPLLDRHMQNLQSALEWSKEHEPLLFSQLVEVLFQFLQLRGQSKKLEQYLPIAKDIAERTGHPGRQANLLQSLGDLERRLGKIDEARAHYDAALPLYRSERDRLGEANLLQSLGDLERRLGKIDEARAHYDAALPLYRSER